MFKGGPRLLRMHNEDICDCNQCRDRAVGGGISFPIWKAVVGIIVLAAIAAFLMVSCQPAHAQVSAGRFLSPHFTQAEFNQNAQPLPLDAYRIDPKLIQKLEVLRKICKNRPIVITSGYRSPSYNAHVGGARHSQHMHGKAADIRVAGIDNRMLANYARIVGFSFVKVYENHVHVDVR